MDFSNGTRCKILRPNVTSSAYSSSIEQVLRLVEKKYVDSIDIKAIQEQAIEDILSQLDPHSVYIPAEELAKANEPLKGNFEGIGVGAKLS